MLTQVIHRSSPGGVWKRNLAGDTVRPVTMLQRPTKLAVLISGSGSTLMNLVEQISSGQLDCEIALVIASRNDIKGCDRARQAGLPLLIFDRKAFDSIEVFNQAVFDAIEKAKVDLICLAGWLCKLQIAPPWEERILNIHPSLLPKFGGQGMYGRHVHQAVIDAGESETGCTVHLVNNEYDTGPIILQKKCDVKPGDTAESLAARVFALEKMAYPEAISKLQNKQR